MKIALCIAMWMLTIGMSYLIGDIAFGSDISEYLDMTNVTAAYVGGGLVIVLVYGLWYFLRRENKWLDIFVPACALFLWGLAKKEELYAGGRGALYSIASRLRESYGLRTGFTDMEYVDARSVTFFVVFVTAILMFFSAYMICRYNSLMIAIALVLLFMSLGAVLSVHASPQGMIISAVAVIVLRYLLMRGGQGISFVWNIAVPLSCMAVCLLAALVMYNGAYEKGVQLQPKIIDLADSIEYRLVGDNGNGYSNYYRIDDKHVNPTDEVVDEIVRDELPEGNLYISSRRYTTYEDGTWRGRDAGYSYESDIYTDYDRSVFAELERDARDVASGRNTFSLALMSDIQRFIRNRMTYTTEPGGFAEEDPVMYALYEGHEGYCIHFASAAAIAFRCLGIASRYDVGYMIPSSAWTRQEDGTYRALVLEKYSHAWTEAYSEDDGEWLVVDATPTGDMEDMLGIQGQPEQSIGDASEAAGNEQSDPADESSLADESDLTDESDFTEDVTDEDGLTEDVTEGDAVSDSPELTETTKAGETGGNTAGSTEDAESGGTGAKASAENSKMPEIPACAAGAVMALIAVIILLELRRRTIIAQRRRRLKSRNRINAIYELSDAMYGMLEFAGMTEGASEDDADYARVVSERCKIIKGDEFEKFVECVQAAVYGQVAPGDEQIKSAAKLYNNIRAYTYLSLGFRDRLVWRYVKCYDTAGRVR